MGRSKGWEKPTPLAGGSAFEAGRAKADCWQQIPEDVEMALHDFFGRGVQQLYP